MMRCSHLFLILLVLIWSTAARALPEIQSWTTKKGAKVLFVEAHELPMVDIRLVFDAGSARDGEKAGVLVLLCFHRKNLNIAISTFSDNYRV